MSRSSARNLCKFDLQRSVYIHFVSLQKLILHFMLGIANHRNRAQPFRGKLRDNDAFFPSDFGLIVTKKELRDMRFVGYGCALARRTRDVICVR